MFYYFGSKSRLAPHYPKPRFDLVIEPFAGSAAYSIFHRPTNAILIDKDERIVDLWRQLLASNNPAEDFPCPKVGTRTSDILAMTRAASEHSLTSEYITVTERMVSRWPNLIRRIEEGAPIAKNWEILWGSWEDAPDVEATWFIDPPYVGLQRGYREGSSAIDYQALSDWCQSLKGQVIVCEREGASWLPFEPLATHRVTNGRKKMEVVWVSDDLQRGQQL